MTKFIVNPQDSSKRLDLYLSEKEPELTRSHIQKITKEGFVTVNGNPAKSSYKLKADDEVSLTIPPPKKLEILPENIPLDIVYEDKDLLVVNKPQGMVVHPAVGNHSGTLVNALLYHTKDLSGINGVLRPGIVHRLDRDTSGLLMIAKNDKAHLGLAKQIEERSVTRQYVALVEGKVKEDEGMIIAPIGRSKRDRKKMTVILSAKGQVPRGKSKEAITYFKVVERFKEHTLLQVELKTGRTHQIRVHMNHIKHPIVGDPDYGRRKQRFNLPGQLLHAQTLGFIHPQTKKYLEFSRPAPKEMERILRVLGK